MFLYFPENSTIVSRNLAISQYTYDVFPQQGSSAVEHRNSCFYETHPSEVTVESFQLGNTPPAGALSAPPTSRKLIAPFMRGRNRFLT